MTVGKGKAVARGNSASPMPDTTTTAGESVKVAAEQNGSKNPTAVPSWKGPTQESGPAVNGDPFEKGNAKLSGGATSFKPASVKPPPIQFLNRDSTADAPERPVIVSSDPAVYENGNKSVQQPIGTRGENFSPTRPRVFFSTDVGPDVISPGGHYVKILSVPGSELDDILKALYEGFGWNSKVHASHIPPPDVDSKFLNIFLCFNDVRDAAGAFEEIQTVQTNWDAVYISQTEFASAKKAYDGGSQDIPTSFHDGQVVFVATFKGRSTEFILEGVFENVHEFAKRFGEVLAFAERDTEGGCWQFRCEYHKISVAQHVLATLTLENSSTIGKWALYAKDLPDYTVQAAPRDSATTPYKGNQNSGIAQFASPTGRTAWCIDENGKEVPAKPIMQLPKCQSATVAVSTTPQHRHSVPEPQTPAIDLGPRSDSWPPTATSYRRKPFTPMSQGMPNIPYDDGHGNTINGEPQNVIPSRIQAGHDVRTTIMVRNLPNEMTCHQLKEVLDRVCFGRYDFSYLRIDFSNNLNVGYGFVNFLNPMDIAHFNQMQVGRPWLPGVQTFNQNGKPARPRLAEISYATVQGQDCLIEKFRNSSVMQERDDCRPKVFYSERDHGEVDPALISKEAPFPPPNNESKRQRSMDNAGQVGLYRSGNRRNRGSGDRHRRSQYDRGTTAQIQEEAWFNQGYNTVPPNQSGYGYPYVQYPTAPATMPVGPPAQYQPMMYGNGMPMHGMPMGAVIRVGPHGCVPFTNPFNGGYAPGPSTPTRLPGGGRQQNITVRPPRDIMTAIRQVAEDRANDPEFDGGPLHSPTYAHNSSGCGVGNLPRVLEDDEEGEEGNNAPQHAKNGTNINGHTATPTAYHGKGWYQQS